MIFLLINLPCKMYKSFFLLFGTNLSYLKGTFFCIISKMDMDLLHSYCCLLKIQGGLYEKVKTIKIQNLTNFWLLKMLILWILPSLNDQNIVILRMFERSKVHYIDNWTLLLISTVSAFKCLRVRNAFVNYFYFR